MIIYEIIKKNFKIILRNPLILFLLFILPIILIFLVGLSFSSTTYTNLNFGLINSDGSLLNLGNGINFIKYNGNVFESRKNCINDLDTGYVKICLEIILKKNSKNETVSGKIIYYIDNTQHLLSGYIVNSLDNYVKKKENEFSKAYLDVIFTEANNSLTFMKDAKKQLDLIDENLNYVENEIKFYKTSINSKTKNFNSNITNIKTDFENLIQLVDEINKKEKVFTDTLNNIDEKVIFIEKKLFPNIDKLEILLNNISNSLPKNTPKNITDNIKNAQNIIYSIKELKINIVNIKKEINSTHNLLENISVNYLNEKKLNETFNIINGGNNSLTDINKKLNETLNLTRTKKEEIKIFKKNLDELIIFLENYNNITEEVFNKLFNKLFNSNNEKSLDYFYLSEDEVNQYIADFEAGIEKKKSEVEIGKLESDVVTTTGSEITFEKLESKTNFSSSSIYKKLESNTNFSSIYIMNNANVSLDIIFSIENTDCGNISIGLAVGLSKFNLDCNIILKKSYDVLAITDNGIFSATMIAK